MLAGNKADCERPSGGRFKQEVSYEELNLLGQKLNVCGIAITSAKKGTAVEETFTAIAESILVRRLLDSTEHPHAALIAKIEALIKTLTQEKASAFFERAQKSKDEKIKGLQELLDLLRFDLQKTPAEHVHDIKIQFPTIDVGFFSKRTLSLLEFITNASTSTEREPQACVIS